MKRTIILNGPPRSGKDTIAEYISDKFGYTRASFKEPLIDSTCFYYGVDRDWFMNRYEEDKEVRQENLNGLSRRQALIHVSENVMKPQRGKGIFGEMLAASMVASENKKFVFSDGGFPEEFLEIKKYDPNVVLVHLYRPGCDFSNDSRDYIPSMLANNFFVIQNDILEKTKFLVDIIMEKINECN